MEQFCVFYVFCVSPTIFLSFLTSEKKHIIITYDFDRFLKAKFYIFIVSNINLK